MEVLMAETTYKLLTVLCMIRGTYGVLIHYNVSVTAVEGQNVRLPCYVGEESELVVIQLEWAKEHQGNENDQKIVVFFPSMPEYYFKPGSLLTRMNSSKTGKLQGSILTLYKVTMKDSGNYLCEITSYPNGSIKRTTKLQVTEPPPLVRMMSHPYGFIKERDDVKITCSVRPPPSHYKLRRSKDKLFWMESLNGEFILPNITRSNSDLYVCLPEWERDVHNLQGLNTTMELTVNFVDDIECNTSSPLIVSFGEDVVISCIAKASQHLQYKWMQGDTILSHSDTLSLTSMTYNQSGTYKLTAVFQNNQLQRDIEFSIHVLSKQNERMTTLSPERTTKHLRNFTSMGMSSRNTGAIETTTDSGHFRTSTSKPNATLTNLQPRHTSHHTPLNDSSSAPSVGNASTLHATTVKSSGTSCTEKPCSSPDPITRGKIVTACITKNNITTTKTSSKESKGTAYIVVPIVLLFLVLTVLLYKRYLHQKKMDMPPPFKPPPPPVKYTSVRNHDVTITDILV